MVNFALLKSAVGYADDTSNSNSLVAGLNADSEVLVNLSKELGLVLNPTKTQSRRRQRPGLCRPKDV